MPNAHSIMLQVKRQYGITGEIVCESLGAGLINRTWKTSAGGASYVLQEINTHVFPHPEIIDQNLVTVGIYLAAEHPGYFLPLPVSTSEGRTLVWLEGKAYRMMPFVRGSHSKAVVETPAQAEAASRAFGAFAKRLRGLPPDSLQETIPDFHNLALRWQAFEKALLAAPAHRLQAAHNAIETSWAYVDIVDRYNALTCPGVIPKGIYHHDTKISNVLFDDHDQALAVVDLDTLMPGYFFSDLGDMMRTYLPPVSEEEADLEKIEIRLPIFRAIVRGYLSPLGGVMTDVERQNMYWSGCFAIYMQALRFLIDFLNGDVYYGAAHPDHNLVRANNQFRLLERYVSAEKDLQGIVTEELNLRGNR